MLLSETSSISPWEKTVTAKLHHQQYIACPSRGDGHTCDGIPGDCLRACVATVVGCSPWTLTHYAQHLNWWSALRREARERWGLDWAHMPLEDDEPLRQGMRGGWRFAPGRHLVIASGPSPRGSFYHVTVAAVIVGDGLALEHVHDPHPLGQGLRSVRGLHCPVAPYDPAPLQLALTAGGAS